MKMEIKTNSQIALFDSIINNPKKNFTDFLIGNFCCILNLCNIFLLFFFFK